MLTKDDVRSIINEAVDQSKLKYFADLDMSSEVMWQKPLIGFAAGNDPYFSKYKEEIGEFFWSPSEAFSLKKADEQPKDEELSVVSFILPQVQETKEDNAKQADYPSPRWYVTRGTWEPMIADINGYIVNKLEEAGVQAVAIDDVPGFSRMESEKFGLASKWSHRHAAFVAGLGTFGLSDGLITEKGKAVRISTIIVRHQLEEDKRPYDSHNEYCLFYKDGSCGVCMTRCPVRSITEDGHDKDACNVYLNETIKQKMTADGYSEGYIASCGLCQTDVPCQDRIPV